MKKHINIEMIKNQSVENLQPVDIREIYAIGVADIN